MNDFDLDDDVCPDDEPDDRLMNAEAARWIANEMRAQGVERLGDLKF